MEKGILAYTNEHIKTLEKRGNIVYEIGRTYQMVCVDCDTMYPIIHCIVEGDKIMCNGKEIKKCPYCT